jgi:hypothetical protein
MSHSDVTGTDDKKQSKAVAPVLRGISVRRSRRAEPQTTIREAVLKFDEAKSVTLFSSGHWVEITTPPLQWTTDICSDPDQLGCTSKLVDRPPPSECPALNYLRSALQKQSEEFECWKGCKSESFRTVFDWRGMRIRDLNDVEVTRTRQ